jgi:hypothetical protein
VSFLFPAFLLGALAIAIPIALHFMRRDVAPEVPFSAVRLLSRSPVERSRRRRLRDLLLLAARVAALLLLAIRFRAAVRRRTPPRLAPTCASWRWIGPSACRRQAGSRRRARWRGRGGRCAPMSERIAVDCVRRSRRRAGSARRAGRGAPVAGGLRAGPGATRYGPMLARAVELPTDRAAASSSSPTCSAWLGRRSPCHPAGPSSNSRCVTSVRRRPTWPSWMSASSGSGSSPRSGMPARRASGLVRVTGTARGGHGPPSRLGADATRSGADGLPRARGGSAHRLGGRPGRAGRRQPPLRAARSRRRASLLIITPPGASQAGFYVSRALDAAARGGSRAMRLAGEGGSGAGRRRRCRRGVRQPLGRGPAGDPGLRPARARGAGDAHSCAAAA